MHSRNKWGVLAVVDGYNLAFAAAVLPARPSAEPATARGEATAGGLAPTDDRLTSAA